jgi:mannose-6-phosphate isomerase-like protein (cupin superfamily)
LKLKVPPEHVVRHISQIKPTACPCGQSFRIITEEDNGSASFHVVEIDGTAQKHYHEHHTEYYYCLEGSGHIELDDQLVPFEPGTCVMIPPGTRHAARGKFKIINVVIPPFDPEDEIIVDPAEMGQQMGGSEIHSPSSAIIK